MAAAKAQAARVFGDGRELSFMGEPDQPRVRAVEVSISARPVPVATSAVYQFTVSTNTASPVPEVLEDMMTTLLVAAVVGVPLMSPVVVLMLNPAGRPVAL